MSEISNNGGNVVSGAGDINGDGLSDVIIGTPISSSIVFGSQQERPASLYLGSLNGDNGFSFIGNAYSVSGAGDVNGDGLDDILVGDIQANNYTGKTSVIFGSNQTWPGFIDQKYLDGKHGFTINGIHNNDKSGYSVSGAGDINGDGLDDILIGAPDAANHMGQSYVVFGSSTPSSAVLNLADLNGANGFTINGVDQHFDGSGASVSWAGDVNGDGLDDILIGTAGVEYTTGESYLILGHKQPWPASINLDSLNGTNGCTIHGAGHRFGLSGSAVSGAGDINGDNLADILIGAWGVNNTAGQSYLVFGNKEWPAAIDLGNLNGKNGFTINGINIDDYSFSSVDGAGDMNGDGLADILISAYAANNYAGQTFVVYGRNQTWPASIDLDHLDGTNGFTVNSGSLYGISSNGAGDVNGNGINDIIIGTLNSNDDVDQSYVVYGHVEATPENGDYTLALALGICGGIATLAAVGLSSYYGYQNYLHADYQEIN